MRKNTIIAGIVVLVVGIVLAIIGGIMQANANDVINAGFDPYYPDESDYYDAYDQQQNAETQLLVGVILYGIGVILGFIGFIVLIAGLALPPKSESDVQQSSVSGHQPASFSASHHMGGGSKRERHCPGCGRYIQFDAKFCPYCGRNFESYSVDDKKGKEEITDSKGEGGKKKKFCSECGSKIEIAGKFCPHCGNKM